MKVFLLTTACSDAVYNQIVSGRKKPKIDSGQKFFSALAESLVRNGADVHCIVSRPVSFSTFPKRHLNWFEDSQNGVKYEYLPVFNFPFFRNLFLAQSFKKTLRRALKQFKGEDCAVLCDSLIYEASLVTKKKAKGVNYISVVTDIPSLVGQMINSRGIKGYFEKQYSEKADKLIPYYDGYIFLTQKMSDVCNPNSKPYLTMECITKTIDFPDRIKLADKPVVLYAGKLLKDCGILELAKSAELLSGVCEIWLYGSDCDCEEELSLLASKTKNLIVHDAVPFNELYKIEASSDILINPRPDDKDFVQYSFPSKTVEYLQTGVPVLMFKLRGVPDEYDDYINYIPERSPKSIAEAILRVLSLPSDVKRKMGLAAKSFIKKEKSVAPQGKKVLSFLNSFKGVVNE